MPWQQPWLPAPFLCPAVPWKRRISPGVGGHSLRCPLQVAPQPARFPASLPIEDCGKPRFGEGDPQKVLSPPLRKGPSCPDIYSKHPSTEAPGAGASLGPGITCPGRRREPLGAGDPPPGGGGQPPRLASPWPAVCSLRSPEPCAGPWQLPGLPAETEEQVDVRESLSPNFQVVSLFSAFLVCFLGRQVLILVALFR